ncbi:hypothetical protein [Niabella hibiscisoli]|uniref:hypothetical protein n=1 Tax=Niabella hibiscisoli TaxID=1825928 RepID=UPI001F0CF861|nr:hypothetical protein [Niabella hibiscisoli]MCH5720768.1 hypothetical protein [Niabella hibiscisoli]
MYYDGLLSAAMIARSLGKNEKQVKDYIQRAAQMKSNIEKYFGATIEGFNTYRYYKGNDTLRSWIATPLVMDIFDRKKVLLTHYFLNVYGRKTDLLLLPETAPSGTDLLYMDCAALLQQEKKQKHTIF